MHVQILYLISDHIMINWLKQKFVFQKEVTLTEDQLKNSGFDPTQITTAKLEQEPFGDFSQDFIGFMELTPSEIDAIVERFKFFSTEQQHRHQLSYKSGGKICGDIKQVDKLRSVGKEMIKDIGRKLISGNFNLTKISFPIKAMVPRTSLQTSTYGSCTFPLYMRLAIRQKQPLEKMKFVITALISPNYYLNMFLKPLNPVIGQTFQGEYTDGTKLYCQQVSHHPPISYFLIIGPKQSYRFYGYYEFQAKAGLNSGKLINTGKRWLEFQSGQKFSINIPNVQYEGVFLGIVRESSIGQFTVKEQKQNLSFTTEFGNVRKKPKDYFQGNIMSKEKNVAKVYGSYLGFIDIDQKRYWSGNQVQPFRIFQNKNVLKSDSSYRKDLRFLEKGKMIEAQQAKQQIEQLQRKDKKLRQKVKLKAQKKKALKQQKQQKQQKSQKQ